MIFKTQYFDGLVDAVRTGNLPKEGPEVGENIVIKSQRVKLEVSLGLAYPKLVRSLKRLNTRKVYFTFSDVPARGIHGPIYRLALDVKGKQVDLILAAHNGYFIIVAAYIDESMAVHELEQHLRSGQNPSTATAA